jgi:NAD(P)-dependent dehydrogenase (short-subunit alcohol dehydrogenase family)
MANLPELFDLTGRVAVVTGGAGLLGAEFCRTLAEAGAQVSIADVNGEAAGDLAASLNERWPARATGLQVDVSVSPSVREMVASTLQTFGRLDILVNCAALDPKFDRQHSRAETPGERASGEEEVVPPTVSSLSIEFEDYPLELWQQALDVNLTGMFLCCQAAVPPMLEQGKGVIVNVCSIYGLVGPDQRLYRREGEAPQYKPVYYSVTKAGVLGLTRYLATYFAGKGIRVNALTPGGVFNQHDDRFVQAYSARTVLGRMAKKDEMNGALLFLASDASAYMTGSNLIVDGGWTAW